MRKVILEQEAQRDVHEAHDWYEGQLRGLGVRFEDSLDEALVWANENTNLCREIRPGVRKYLISAFPYAVYFKVSDEVLRVFAVLHGSRDPDIVHHRLNSGQDE